MNHGVTVKKTPFPDGWMCEARLVHPACCIRPVVRRRVSMWVLKGNGSERWEDLAVIRGDVCWERAEMASCLPSWCTKRDLEPVVDTPPPLPL